MLMGSDLMRGAKPFADFDVVEWNLVEFMYAIGGTTILTVEAHF